MPQINVSVPEALKAWVDEQVATGRYSSPSDVIRSVLREQERRARALKELQAALDDGRASGPGRDYKEVFDELRAKRSVAA